MGTEQNNGMVMPIQPMYGNGGGYGDFFGNGSWIILFLLAAMFGGFGGFGGWGMNGMGGMMGGGVFPWLLAANNNTDNNVAAGFAQASTASALQGIQNAVTSGFGDVALGIAGVNQGVCNGFSQAEIAANARQIASMQQDFNNQIANLQAMNNIQNGVTDCCCRTQSGIDNLRYTVSTEACADRQAVNDALQSVTATMNAGFQSIKDQMYSDKMDSKNEKIQELQQQLYMKDLAASQSGQTSTIMAGQRALANEVENYVRPQINPAYVVPNPYCPQNGYGPFNQLQYGW